MGFGERRLDSLRRLTRVVVRNRAIDVMRDVRRSNLVMEPIEHAAVRSVNGEEGAAHVAELVVVQVGHIDVRVLHAKQVNESS